jgi:hypothetical protein
VMNCHGVVSYLGSAQVATTSGVFVSCSDCHSDLCEETLAHALDFLDDPGTSYQQYILQINASTAACARPGDCP